MRLTPLPLLLVLFVHNVFADEVSIARQTILELGELVASPSTVDSEPHSGPSNLHSLFFDALPYKGKSTTITVPSSVKCDQCNGTGGKDGTQPSSCPTCGGMGKVRAQQGFFTVERTCPTCSGKGQMNKNPCRFCSGSGTTQKNKNLSVNIPAGVETGTRIRLTGEGEAGLQNGPAGDLYIFTEVLDHSIFQREGVNLFCQIPISLVSATLGGDIEAPTLDGGKTRVKVPAGIQSGKQLRLRGKGMPNIRGSSYGDLYIELNIETPVNLNENQKDLLRKFEESLQQTANNPKYSNFFSKVKSFWEKNSS